MNEMFVTEHNKWFSTRYCYMDGLCEGAMCTTRTPLGKKEQWLCIYKRNDFAVVVPLEIRQREWSDRGIAHFAHLGGMLFGFLLIRRWRKTRYL